MARFCVLMNQPTNHPVPPTLSSWEYAPETIPAILRITGLKRNAWVAEIGAGSGIFTQHLIGRFNHILALESDSALREMAFRRLGHFPSFCVIDGTPDSTNWHDHSLDLVISTQIIDHPRFEALQIELRRILRNPSWFVVINHFNTDIDLGKCLKQKFPPELLTVFLPASGLEETVLLSYYSQCRYIRMTFPMRISISWLQFLGRLEFASKRLKLSLHHEDRLVATAFEMFSAFGIRGRIQLQMCTEVFIGKL